jgi:hypothetical protein
MNPIQRIILITGTLCVFGLLLFPPVNIIVVPSYCSSAKVVVGFRYVWLFLFTQHIPDLPCTYDGGLANWRPELHYKLLVTEWIGIAVVAFLLKAATKKRSRYPN